MEGAAPASAPGAGAVPYGLWHKKSSYHDDSVAGRSHQPVSGSRGKRPASLIAPLVACGAERHPRLYRLRPARRNARTVAPGRRTAAAAMRG